MGLDEEAEGWADDCFVDEVAGAAEGVFGALFFFAVVGSWVRCLGLGMAFWCYVFRDVAEISERVAFSASDQGLDV